MPEHVKRHFSLLLLAWLILAGCSPAPVYRVSAVIDGDTLKITHPDGSVRQTELLWIDAPEREQPMGRQATLYLQKNLLKQEVSFDKHQQVLMDNTPVAQLLLENGLAWDISQDAPFEIQLRHREIQAQAMNNGVGLWSLEHALRVPPWQWRQDAKKQSPWSMNQQRQQRRNQQNKKEQP